MLEEMNDRTTMIRCVSCGKYILTRIKGRYEGDVECDKCGTHFHLDIDRTDLTIEYSLFNYRERRR